MKLEDVAKKIRPKKERVDTSILYSPQPTAQQQLFESITMPHWTAFVTPGDINSLYQIITSASLAGNFDKKKKMIDEIMESRGFKYMSGGTNRMVYRHYEFPTIVAKVPIDKVGLNDNFCEYKNQKYLWPYCAKMIQVAPLGVIGFAERVEPILNRYQFNAFAPMIYMVTLHIIGEYVMEDIGTKYYKNWGVRKGQTVVLLDYPYLFRLDGRKLICNHLLPNGLPCGGMIDYEKGFNHLYCTRCGRMYNAAELQMAVDSKEVDLMYQSNKIKGGKKPMLVKLMKGDQVLATSLNSDSIVRPDVRKSRPAPKPGDPVATLRRGNEVLAGGEIKEATPAPTKETIVSEIHLPMVEEVKPPMQDPHSIARQQTENATIISELYDNPEVYKPAPMVHAPVVPVETAASEIINPPAPPTQEVEDQIAETISKKFQAPVIETPTQEVVEEATPVEENKDEFPPNQWKTPPTFSKKPRRIITNNTTGENVQVRPKNPYKD